MWKVIELVDYAMTDEGQSKKRAVELLQDYYDEYEQVEVLGYSVNHFENFNNHERSYILIKYKE